MTEEMLFLQFLILLLPSVVSLAPYGEEEGSAFSLDRSNVRPPASSSGGVHRMAPLSFLNSPFFRRSPTESPKSVFQEKDKVLQRKMVWENAIRKERTRSRPDQVLPLGHDALKRSRCNAMPFMQIIYRENCVPVRIPNKFCFGQCNSFYVPGWPSKTAQPCTSCSPTRSKHIAVPLACRGGWLSWEKVVLVEECDCETRFEQELALAGSGEGFLPVS